MTNVRQVIQEDVQLFICWSEWGEKTRVGMKNGVFTANQKKVKSQINTIKKKNYLVTINRDAMISIPVSVSDSLHLKNKPILRLDLSP